MNRDNSFQSNESLLAVLSTPGVFTAAECERIVGLGLEKARTAGVARGEFGGIRDSKVCFITHGRDTGWIFSRLQDVVMAANQKYRFQLSGFGEPLQIAEYASGGHYDWHLDIGGDITSGRKLSVSVQLTDGDSYDGGSLEFLNINAPQLPRSIGAITIFPSYLPHRVRPVTRGVRRSLVAWIQGNPFS